MKPLGSKVIVKVEQVREERKAGTLIIELEKSTEDHADITKATVIAVGPDASVGESKLDINDVVYFETHGGFKVTIDGKEVVIVDIKNVLVVI